MHSRKHRRGKNDPNNQLEFWKTYLLSAQLWQIGPASRGKGEGRRQKPSHLDRSYCRLCRCAQHVPHGLMGKGEVMSDIQIFLIYPLNLYFNSVSKPLTNSMQEEFGLGGEVVVDNVVQQGDVYTTSSNVRHNQHHGFPMHKLPNVDLPGGLIQGAVDVGTIQTF